MKGKWTKCFLLFGLILMLIVSAAGVFTLGNKSVTQAENKYIFESIYANTEIDFIVPSPSKDQLQDDLGSYGVEAITGYYETKSKVEINGSEKSGTVILLPDSAKIKYTPYTDSRVLNGRNIQNGGEAIVDTKYAEKNSVSIGDTATISILGKEMEFSVVGISEENTYYDNGTIALVLTKEDADEFAANGIVLSGAYVKASNYDACKTYLYTDYKPYGRLKDRTEFDTDDAYNQHVENFNSANWSKEITNCAANFDELKIKYAGVDDAIITNAVIYAVVVIIAFLILIMLSLNGSEIQSTMKQYIIKKGGTIKALANFYKKGIIVDLLVFVIANIGFYYLIVKDSVLGLVGNHAVVIGIPVVAVCVEALLLMAVTGAVVKKRYTIKKSEAKTESEEK